MRSRSTRRQLEQVVRAGAQQVARRTSRPPRGRRSRRGSRGRGSCPPRSGTSRAPSVATVTTASSGPEAELLRRLDAGEDVADRRRCRTSGSAARIVLRHARRAARWARPASVLRRTRSWSVARSETSTTRSVFITLWISGMCLSPIPWMLCSPKPLLEHRRALEGLDRDDLRPVAVLEPVAGADRARRAGGRDERRRAGARAARPARASTTRSSARPVTGQWTRWFPNSQNWLRMTLAGSCASSAQAS